MKKQLIALSYLATLSSTITSTPLIEKLKKNENIITTYKPKISGYLKSEYWFDSRQVSGLRDNQYLLYPLNQYCDALGQDINASGQYNASIIQSRIRADFSAPLIYNIIPKAVFEADFFGIGATFPVFRPRHVYTTLANNNITFLLGHTWQPLFVKDCYPDTINFNTGAPIEVFSRQSQIRFVIDYKGFEWFVAALAELETPSTGPNGSSSQYLRNSIIPNLHMQTTYRFNNTSLVGAAIDFLHLVPRLVTEKNLYAQEYVDAVRAAVFSKIHYKDCVIKAKAIYAENGYDIELLGGYGVTYIDPVTDRRTYTPTRTVSVWGEIAIGKKFEPAIFVGWSKNIGTKKRIIPTYNNQSLLYTRGSDIESLIRVAPRARWHLDPCIIGFELEYTRALYGTITDHAKPCNTTPVSNIRAMGAVYYTF